MLAKVKAWRIGTVLAFYGITLAFVLSVYLKDGSPFMTTAPVAIGGKWLENYQERRRAKHTETEPE